MNVVAVWLRLAGAWRGALASLRGDDMTRSSVLLMVDYLVIGAVGGICAVLGARFWSPQDVGAVSGASAAFGLITGASSSGFATMINRFLREEENQRTFVIEAAAISSTAGVAMTAAVCFIPGHFGVPLRYLHAPILEIFLIYSGFVVASALVAVVDPAFTARRQVSVSVIKDCAAAAIRIGTVLALIGTGAIGLLVATIAEVAAAGVIDFGLIFRGLVNRGPRVSFLRFGMTRRRIGFALSSHSAALISALPGTLFTTIVAAHFGAREAAFVGIPLYVSTYINLIPQTTSQALLAELATETIDVAKTAVRALRFAYVVSLPAVILLEILAPLVLLIFGHRYSVHGVGYFRWGLAATVLQTTNYVGDTVLLARQKMVAYNAVNAFGTAGVIAFSLSVLLFGLSWIGPAIVLGQVVYLTGSVTALMRYGSVSDLRRSVRQLRWRPV